MARGSQSKEEITQRILETFPGSFINEKEIRIPWTEGAENLQVKISLTCAKTNVECNTSNVTPGETVTTTTPAQEPSIVKPTEEEKANVAALMAKLGL